MAKSEMEEVTRKAIENGGILAKEYFDMHSEKADDLQPLMTDLISNRLLKFPGVIYCAGEIDEPIKVEELYATNAVVTILVKDLWTLLNISDFAILQTCFYFCYCVFRAYLLLFSLVQVRHPQGQAGICNAHT